MQLLLALLGKIFAEGVLYILFREENADILEVGIIGSHAIVLQSRNGMHTLFGHILLSEYDGELLGTVVTEVNEDDHVTFLDGSVYAGIVDGFDELIGHALIIALLHGLHHVGSLLTLAFYDEVVCFLHTLPTLITVHGIETTDDAGDMGIILLAAGRNLLDESLTTFGVCVTTIHVAVYEQLVLQTVCLTNLNEFEEVVEAGVNTTVRGKTHQVQFLVVFLSVSIGGLHLRVLHDGTVFAGTVDLYQVLIHDASRTDIEVAHFRVSHLTVGQSYVFSTGHQL